MATRATRLRVTGTAAIRTGRIHPAITPTARSTLDIQWAAITMGGRNADDGGEAAAEAAAALDRDRLRLSDPCLFEPRRRTKKSSLELSPKPEARCGPAGPLSLGQVS